MGRWWLGLAATSRGPWFYLLPKNATSKKVNPNFLESQTVQLHAVATLKQAVKLKPALNFCSFEHCDMRRNSLYRLFL